MLRVIVELIPNGYVSQKRTIREIDITNTTIPTYGKTDEPDIADYKITSRREYIGYVWKWDRSRPVEELVQAALGVLLEKPLRDY